MLLLLLLLIATFKCKSFQINNMHGGGIEPPICPDTFQHRLEMSILSGFPGSCEILDCRGWHRMLSFLLSYGWGLETQ